MVSVIYFKQSRNILQGDDGQLPPSRADARHSSSHGLDRINWI
jgi:hypothetical protein